MYDLEPNLPYIVPTSFKLHYSLNHGKPVRSPNDRYLPLDNPKNCVVLVMEQYFIAQIRKTFLEVAILAGLDEPEDKIFSLTHMFIYYHLQLYKQQGYRKLELEEGEM